MLAPSFGGRLLGLFVPVIDWLVHHPNHALGLLVVVVVVGVLIDAYAKSGAPAYGAPRRHRR